MANEHEIITFPVAKSGIRFVHELKVLFHGKRKVYDEFIKEMHDFKIRMNDRRVTRLAVQEFKKRTSRA